jgi:esterase/lipase
MVKELSSKVKSGEIIFDSNEYKAIERKAMELISERAKVQRSVIEEAAKKNDNIFVYKDSYDNMINESENSELYKELQNNFNTGTEIKSSSLFFDDKQLY